MMSVILTVKKRGGREKNMYEDEEDREETMKRKGIVIGVRVGGRGNKRKGGGRRRVGEVGKRVKT